MSFARPDHNSDLDRLPRIPISVTSARAETHEDVAFLSGAALNHPHLVLGREEVPQSLLRDCSAQRVAEACVAISGRPEPHILPISVADASRNLGRFAYRFIYGATISAKSQKYS